MKKLLLSLIMVLVLTACGANTTSTETAPPQNMLEEIQQRGELIVGTSPDYAPFEFIDPSKLGQDQYVGADIDLAQQIADDLGVKLTVKAMNFDDIPTAVKERKFDIGLSGFTYTDDRAKVIQFSEPYDNSESLCQGFLVRSDNTFTSLDDFNNATVTVQNGSVQQQYTEQQLPGANVRFVTALEDGALELKAGKTDAVAVSCKSGEGFLANNPELKLSDTLFAVSDAIGTMVIMPLGEPELLEAVNTSIIAVKDAGLYTQWLSDAKALSAQVGELGAVKPNVFTLLGAYGNVFWQGTLGTIWLSLIVVFFGTIGGALLALSKMSKFKPLQWFATAYIELVRGTPILLQLYLFVFGGAQFFPNGISDQMWVIFALIFNSSAYVAEIFRAGIQAVDKGQFEAAKSLGLSDRNMMIKVIMPQAVKNILPALGNEFITMIKETSLASIFFINSLMTSQSIVSAATHMKLEALMIVGVIYFILTFSLSKVVQYFEKKGQTNHD